MKNECGNPLTVGEEILTQPDNLLVRHSYFIFCSKDSKEDYISWR